MKRSLLFCLERIVLAFALSIGAMHSPSLARDLPSVEITPPIGHAGVVTAVRLFASDQLVASASFDGTIIIWDMASGRTIRRIVTGRSGPLTMAISPDGRRAVTSTTEREIDLWNIETGELLWEITGQDGQILTLEFSSDGLYIATGGIDKEIYLWSTADGRKIRGMSGHTGAVTAISFLDDGHLVSGSTDETIKIWDLATGKAVSTTLAHDRAIRALAITPDGRRVVSSGEDRKVRLWDVASMTEIRTLDSAVLVTSLALSPDGRRLLTGGIDAFANMVGAKDGKLVKLWDLETGQVVTEYQGHQPPKTRFVNDSRIFVTMSRDGRRIVSGSDDCAVMVWDAASGDVLQVLRGYATIFRAIGFAPKQPVIAVGGDDGSVRLVDTKSGRQLGKSSAHSAGIDAIEFLPNGASYVTAARDATAILWPLEVGNTARTLRGQKDWLNSVAVSADSKKIAVGSRDGTVALWDLRSGSAKILPPQERQNELSVMNPKIAEVSDVAIAPDGQTIYVSSDDGTIRIWNWQGKLLQTVQGPGATAFLAKSSDLLSLSSDGSLLARCGSRDLSVLNARTGAIVKTLDRPVGLIGACSFLPDGRRIATSNGSGAVSVWDLQQAQPQVLPNAHRDYVGALAVSPDGKWIATGGNDQTIRLWDVESRRLLTTIYPFSGDAFVTLTPEGFFDATPEAAKALTVVRGLEVYSIDQVWDQLYRPDLVREKIAGDPKGLVKAAAAKINLDAAISSGAPPKVAFLDPPATVASATTKLTVDLADQGGGVGKVEWRVNGVTVGLEARGVGRSDLSPTAAGRSTRISRDIALSPGDNTVEVVAFNAKGLVASQAAVVKVASTVTVSGRGRLYVLAIGVNDYFDSRLRLNYAVPDAAAVVDGFKAAKGTLYDSVETTLIADADVAADTLDATFDAIAARARPQDTFVLFVAGHGKTVDGRYYYLPRDFRYRDENSIARDGIGQDRFQAWLAKVKARRSVLLFDTCESGSLTEDRVALRGVERAVAMEKMTAAMGRTTIAAASDDKPALEGYRGHGVFTYAVLQGLAAADGNNDGAVDVLELIRYLDETVPELSDKAFKFRQIPQTKFSGNNFALAARAAVAVGPIAPVVITPAAAAPTKPTHVLIAPADVLSQAGSGATVLKLEPGTQISIVRTDAGWVLVARDGRQLGYVKETALLRLQ